MWRDLDTLDSFLDKLGCDFGFVLANVTVTEEELTVQVGDVDGVHVDYMDFFKAGEGEIFEDFAAEAARAATVREYFDSKCRLVLFTLLYAKLVWGCHGYLAR